MSPVRIISSKIQLKSFPSFRVSFALYSCRKRSTPNNAQLEYIQQGCNGQEECEVNVWHGGFVSCPSCLQNECPGASESEFLLWLTYECRGGFDRTITVNTGHQCQRPTTRPTPRPAPRTTRPTTRRTTRRTTTMMMCRPVRRCLLFFCWNTGCNGRD